ncbi:MAG: S9 family peptidase [Fluviicola sp.]|nr:S9 family peptidase [Fluviicola sp.]
MSFKLLITFLLVACYNLTYSQEITVEKIWSEYEFFGKSVNGFQSMNDGNYFSKTSSKNHVTKHQFSDYEGSGETIISAEMLGEVSMQGYSFNKDETKALIETNTKSIYRRSYSAVYYLLDLKTNKLQELDSERQPQTLAEYSPDGKKVSYIYKNNLYVKDIASGKVTTVTTDGEANSIINGTTDWVYEEEFAIIKGYDWSPDSKYIAFLKFDESEVTEFTMMYFNKLYPESYTFKYPKAGEDNSKVTVNMYSMENSKTELVELGDYEYIPRLKWSDKENKLVVQTMNRHQNNLKYHLVTMENSTLNSKVFYEESADAYIDIDDNLLILDDGETILRTSEKNGYNHIYKLCFDGKIEQITTGNWDVIEFLGVDEESNTIYYTSAEEGAIHESIYKILLSGKKKKLISKATGSNSADFSNGMKYFIKTYSDANTPPVYSLCNNNGKELAVLEDNSALKGRLSQYNLSKKEFVKFKGAEIELNGWMIKPPNFDATKKYPVYINIYGGPGSNMVSDSWGSVNYMYHQLLAQKGYIVISVDPRGTMYRGEKFKKSTYLQLGKLETEDFIAVAKELQTYDYVDASRIGIMGWSYGGFMTSLAMTKGADYFKMGIAVAPVTNWRYYDNIYTERFMRTPQENADGYDDNSPINFTDKLKGKYLLIHGSGDDNVHYQNTMEMVNAMVASNKQFDLFIYPNKNHGIYGGNTRNHLFNMMLAFTLENL